jgi:hypothetical protein
LNANSDERSFGPAARGFFAAGFFETGLVATGLTLETFADFDLLELVAMGLRYHPASSA